MKRKQYSGEIPKPDRIAYFQFFTLMDRNHFCPTHSSGKQNIKFRNQNALVHFTVALPQQRPNPSKTGETVLGSHRLGGNQHRPLTATRNNKTAVKCTCVMDGWTVMIAWRSGHVASIQTPTLYSSKSFNSNRADVIVVNCQSQLCDDWIVAPWHWQCRLHWIQMVDNHLHASYCMTNSKSMRMKYAR